MNIYHITWVQGECYGLSAVMVAPDQDTALAELDLDTTYNSDIRIIMVGIAIPEFNVVTELARESL